MKYDIESIEKRKKQTQVAKKVFNVVLIILIYNIILVFISSLEGLGNVRVFGYKSFIITTTSMEPHIKSGDVVIVKDTKKEDLKEGDVITFQNNEVITHRIVKIETDEDKTLYTTKGDNNNIQDKELIEHSALEGKVVLTIPKLGSVIKILQNKIIILILLLLLLIVLFIKIQREEKKNSRREKKKIESSK